MLFFFYVAQQCLLRIGFDALLSTFIISCEKPTHYPYLNECKLKNI